MTTKCLYFAYGSNLLTKRMHYMNPNAVRFEKGYLKDYILNFGGYAEFWCGSPATITKSVGQIVWGAIWELKSEDVPNLDRQEGIHQNIYRPITVKIAIANGSEFYCRSYQQVEKFEIVDLSNLPENRRPSKAYLNTIINGALETKLPTYYIDF